MDDEQVFEYASHENGGEMFLRFWGLNEDQLAYLKSQIEKLGRLISVSHIVDYQLPGKAPGQTSVKLVQASPARINEILEKFTLLGKGTTRNQKVDWQGTPGNGFKMSEVPGAIRSSH